MYEETCQVDDKSVPEEIGMSAIHSDGVITLAVCFDANGPETRQSRKSITSSQNSWKPYPSSNEWFMSLIITVSIFFFLDVFDFSIFTYFTTWCTRSLWGYLALFEKRFNTKIKCGSASSLNRFSPSWSITNDRYLEHLNLRWRQLASALRRFDIRIVSLYAQTGPRNGTNV